MASKIEIFNKIPPIGEKVDLPPIDAKEFEKVVETRRSVRVYLQEPIPDEVVHKCLQLALLAPNSSNLQPWQFYRVCSPDKKALLVEYCLGQPAAATAAELIVAVARPDHWKPMGEKMLAMLKERPDAANLKGPLQYYGKIVPLAYDQGFLGIKGRIKQIALWFRGLKTPTPRGPVSTADMLTWAHKSTALACQNLMLAFRAYGYDSCPMEGIDPVRIAKLLQLPKAADVCMVISAGKRADNGVYGPRIRFDESLFLKEI